MNLIIQLEHLDALIGSRIEGVHTEQGDRHLIFTCEGGKEVILGAKPTEEKVWDQEETPKSYAEIEQETREAYEKAKAQGRSSQFLAELALKVADQPKT